MQQAIFHRALVILMGVAFIVLDQWVKALALVGLDHQSFHFGGSRIGLEVALSLNPGAFLSLGAGLSPQVKQLIFVAGVGVVVCWGIGWALSRWTASAGRAAAVYFIALGGASNLIDRVYREGHVVDYLFVNLGPIHTGVFNIADIAIVAGALALVFVGSKGQGRLS